MISLPMRFMMQALLFLALEDQRPATADSMQDRGNAPVITNLKFEPAAAPQGGRVTLRVQVFDRQGREDIIPILYLLREGIELIKTGLYDDGSHGDLIARDGFYTGTMTVPLTTFSGSHWFVVFLYDQGGHRSNLLIYEFWVLDLDTLVKAEPIP
jgi:hypothetical protein